MTFEHFYSMARPHKAASFNTVKRARVKIVCILTMSTLFNIPHLYITAQEGRSCIPFGNAIDTVIGQFYHWISLVVNFALPFVSLLKAYSHRANANAKAKKITGQSEEIKKISSKHQIKFSLSHSLSLGVGRPLQLVVIRVG